MISFLRNKPRETYFFAKIIYIFPVSVIPWPYHSYPFARCPHVSIARHTTCSYGADVIST